jgi:hypothetical protein
VRPCAPVVLTIVALLASAAPGQIVVFQAINNNGFFAPFNAANAATVTYGDSGWLSASGTDTYTLTSITLGLAVLNSTATGTTDLVFTFNDGDPSGLVFGPGTALYSTTVQSVQLPDASQTGGLAYFSLTIPLPNVRTTGGFNNIGWSVALANFQCNGQFGFQCSRSTGQQVGSYTNNASYFDGASWSLFSFGPDPVTGVANFVAVVEGDVTAECYANCDGSTGSPQLTANDFQCFLNRFAAGAIYANCDGVGGLTANDFQCFLNAYAAGCS